MSGTKLTTHEMVSQLAQAQVKDKLEAHKEAMRQGADNNFFYCMICAERVHFNSRSQIDYKLCNGCDQ